MINMISISTNHRAQPPGISTNDSIAVFIFIYLLISFLCKVLHPLSYQARRANVVKNIFPQEICFVSRQQYNLSYTLRMKWILHLADRDDTWIQKRQWQNSVHNYKRFFSHYCKRMRAPPLVLTWMPPCMLRMSGKSDWEYLVLITSWQDSLHSASASWASR